MLTPSELTKLSRDIFKKVLNSTKSKIPLNKYCMSKLTLMRPNLSDLEIGEEVDKILEKVKLYLIKENLRRENLNIAPEYEFDDHLPNILVRYSEKHKEPPILSFLRKHKKTLLTAVNAITWRSFEHLCKHLLEVNGVYPFKITKINQEGLDFCGHIT